MKCNHCGKEVKVIKKFFSDAIGGFIVVRNSDDDKGAAMWPAIYGVKKYHGCVEFGRAIDGCSWDDADDEATISMFKGECEAIFYDYPKIETAWLVTPAKDGYDWERIDDQIEFSD